MRARRFWLDRIMMLGVPRPVAGYAPPAQELAPAVWSLDRQLRMPGGPLLPSRTTIVRLRDGSLVVISAPTTLEPGGAAAIDALGIVRQVVAPNSFHYLGARELMARHPDASLLVAPGLIERVPDLPPARELQARPPEAWAGELDYAVLGPVRGVSEVLLFHLPTGTLILTDLAFNMTRFARAFDRMAWRLAGVPTHFGPSRTARLLLLRDQAAAARCLSRVSEWPIQRIVVAHGEVVEQNAKAEFLKAFAPYLESPPAA